MFTKEEKNYLLLGAAILLYKLLSNKQGSAHVTGRPYAERKEVILHDMINGADENYFVFPDSKISLKERKRLLAESTKFTHSNIEMIFKYNTIKSSLSLIDSSEAAYKYIKNTIDSSKFDTQECFIVLYLNKANKVIAHDMIHVGGLDSTIVDGRILLQKAIILLSTGIIIAHNHPSGANKPSQADLNLTKALKNSLKVLNIDLMDHLIISDIRNYQYYSFADYGEL
ncbi:MAG: JAB domain-containing protein [Saprospiraceae bacterium]|nr:JAB domain-containing protein [Saprospiraceae bacterium]HMW39903.1 JAB domain-containing protein [Saprospiraceae bacterium]HMX89132.1 JAB domain-containing protein [Saprospiraceae bacterium]HMZ40807.1 JAB domain-containing protein [Saprospiraceae bacterium]HNA64583.1 JAB domain-containing protein [Saprospiraceae bacterium]